MSEEEIKARLDEIEFHILKEPTARLPTIDYRLFLIGLMSSGLYYLKIRTKLT